MDNIIGKHTTLVSPNPLRPRVTYKMFCGEDHDTYVEVPQAVNPKPPVRLNNIECARNLQLKTGVSDFSLGFNTAITTLNFASWEYFFINTNSTGCPVLSCEIRA